jgi:hypothetical protein
MIQVTAWQCSHCKMTSIYKSNVRRHEADCPQDVNNNACPTCVNFVYDREGYYCKAQDETILLARHCPLWEAHQ